MTTPKEPLYPRHAESPAAPEVWEEPAIGTADVVDRLEASVRELRAELAKREPPFPRSEDVRRIMEVSEERNALRAEVGRTKLDFANACDVGRRQEARAQAAEADIAGLTELLNQERMWRKEADNLLRTRPTQSDSDGSYTAWENQRIAYLNTRKVPRGCVRDPACDTSGHSARCDLLVGRPSGDAPTKVLVALKEALELLNLCDPEGRRAKFIHAPEDAAIRSMCEATGYGAVMDSAARQWRNRDALGALGAHTTGPAVGSVQRGVALITEALALLESAP